MSVTITRRLEIDAGHRLKGHESKCRNIHGHRYVFEVECSAPRLDSIGRVIDFSVLKQVVGGWLDDNWDHGFIYEHGDEIGEFISEHSKSFMLDFPPTAENLAQHLFWVARSLMAKHEIDVVSVTCHETPNCYSTAR